MKKQLSIQDYWRHREDHIIKISAVKMMLSIIAEMDGDGTDEEFFFAQFALSILYNNLYLIELRLGFAGKEKMIDNLN